jgi:hypothetical protein
MKHARSFAALVIAAAATLAFSVGCENKMEPKECDKIRGEAFDLLNKAQHCNTDVDCRQSDWPGCQKPESQATFDKVKPMKEAFEKGKCEETKSDCKPPPEVFCKQGLCVHREKGADSNATPTDQIIIK